MTPAGDRPRRNRHEKGALGEAAAVRHLEARGLRIVSRNVRLPIGEIDVIAKDGDTLVFVEVKSVSGSGGRLPQEAVSIDKQRRLTRLALWYMQKEGLLRQPARFDVVAVTWRGGDEPEIRWIVNAFEAIE